MKRYTDLIGKNVVLPLVGRVIPIVADEYSDPEKGSGAVKITPGHDFNDFEVGRRHDLEVISVFDLSANLNENAPDKFRGLDRFKVRDMVVAEMDSLGLLEKIEDNPMTVPYGGSVRCCYRTPLNRPVVCRREDHGPAGDKSGGRGHHQIRPAPLGKHVFRMDAQHSALVHFPPNLVGPSNSCLVWA